MPDLLIRPSGSDAALLAKALTPVATRTPADLVVHPRLLLPADLAGRNASFADTARTAGIPFIVDPETYFLQDVQHAADPWAGLPFADRHVLTSAELTRVRQRQIVEAAIEYQIAWGATQLVAPYVHIKRATDGWLERQIGLLRTTATVLAERGIALPTIAVLDLSWRLLDRRTWPDVLLPLLSAVAAGGFDEIGLSGSNIDGGVHPEDRAANLLAAIARAKRTAPVIAWNQGLLGELAVAGGAIGYCTGMGWGEKWDTAARMSRRRAPNEPGPRNARPVYIGKLGRSVPKKTVVELLGYRTIAPDLPCAPGGGCCRDGAAGLTGDARWHALYARVASLRQLTDTDRRFCWRQLHNGAEVGRDLARRINVVTTREGLNKVDDAALRAISTYATVAQDRRRTHVA